MNQYLLQHPLAVPMILSMQAWSNNVALPFATYHHLTVARSPIINPSFVRRRVAPTVRGPINFLPADVLLYIFHTAVHDGSLTAFEKADKAVDLSHVCRGWREVAINTPTLWTNIAIRVDFNITHHAFRHLRRVPYFAWRALKLAVFVTLELRSTRRFESLISELLEILVLSLTASVVIVVPIPVPKFIKSLVIISDSSVTTHLATRHLLPHPIPVLEYLEVKQGDIHRTCQISWPPDETQLFVQVNPQNFPRLRSLILTGTNTNWRDWRFSNLTSLRIQYLPIGDRPTFSALRSMLRLNAHSLREFEILGALLMRDGSWSPLVRCSEEELISLPHLGSLTLGYLNPVEALSFLHTMNLPSLKLLAFRDIARRLSKDHRRAAYIANGVRPPLVLGYTNQPQSDATFFINTMCKHFSLPLAQIQHLELSHVMFHPPPEAGHYEYQSRNDCPTSQIMGGADLAELPIQEPLVAPLRLLLSMPNVLTLALHDPDPAVVAALNIGLLNPNALEPQSVSNIGKRQPWVYPLPKLITLSLIEVHDLHVLTDFLGQRTQNIKQGHINMLRHLDFSVYAKQSELKAAFREAGADMSILTMHHKSMIRSG
ncbi:hypothetical protein BJ138DRAFT_1147782 [Hygrophoropsis aurantiaca]|uniref:Uncharacterized protein n=1 Tax=Hygrophoropsis aurantiaca TaxID=72124 RepID=A0ACB8AJD4_9AGAM|nr:hypothetical protein BJ138DRAFT_1147782 [Hygrophoropsis aurantiaca]